MDALKKIDSTFASTTLTNTAKAQSPEDLKVKEAAKQFESLLLHQMLTAMSANTGKDELMGGSREQEFSRDLYNQALAESISKGRGIGIKDILVRENSKKNSVLAPKVEPES